MHERVFFDRPHPSGYLDEWARRLAEPIQAADDQRTQSVLILRLGDEWMALPTSVLVEVADAQPVHAIPHRTNAVLRGLVNIRGQLRICVSFQGILEIKSDHGVTPQTRMVIIQDVSSSWVFAADEVAGVFALAENAVRPSPSTFPRAVSYSRGLFSWRGSSVGLLDPDRLFVVLRGL